MGEDPIEPPSCPLFRNCSFLKVCGFLMRHISHFNSGVTVLLVPPPLPTASATKARTRTAHHCDCVQKTLDIRCMLGVKCAPIARVPRASVACPSRSRHVGSRPKVTSPEPEMLTRTSHRCGIQLVAHDSVGRMQAFQEGYYARVQETAV